MSNATLWRAGIPLRGHKRAEFQFVLKSVLICTQAMNMQVKADFTACPTTTTACMFSTTISCKVNSVTGTLYCLRHGSNIVFHMRRIECKLAKRIVFAHLHSTRRMWNTTFDPCLSFTPNVHYSTCMCQWIRLDKQQILRILSSLN